MTRLCRPAIALLILAALPLCAADNDYDVVKLADGVHALIWREKPLHSEPNVLIVINDEDVFVVDTAQFPSTARLIVREIRKLTPKPVRYVLNTHWHDDHLLSNFVFQEAWPGVEFIAHPNTLKDAMSKAYGVMKKDVADAQAQLDTYKKMLETGKRPDGTPLTDERRRRVERVVPQYTRYVTEVPTVRPAPPQMTFESSIDLQRGSRTIQLRFLGRGNTRGDVVMYLPKEKILATGDLVVGPVPLGLGSYYRDWVTTLDKLMQFDARTIFLSHGDLQRDFDYVRTVRALLEDLVGRVDAEVAKGATLDQVKQSVTLADWKKKLAGDDEAAQGVFQSWFVDASVARAYAQAKGEPDDADAAP